MSRTQMRALGLMPFLVSLCGCATVGRVAYSRPTVGPADGVRHLGPRESTVALDNKDGVSVQVDFRTARFVGLAGLIVPIIPYVGRDMGSEDLLHVTLWLTRPTEPLVVDPSAITLSVEGRPPMKPVCAIKSAGWRRGRDGGRAYVYLGPSDVSGQCNRGLFARESSTFETGAPTDSVASNDYRAYDLFYPVRFDEPRPLLLRIAGIRSSNGVVALPTVRYERKERWRFAFGSPF